MKKTLGCFAIASGFVLSATLAHADGEKCDSSMHTAQHHGQMNEMTFRKIDTNGDGVISLKEFNAFNARHFKELDTNKDGKLTLDELMGGDTHGMGMGHADNGAMYGNGTTHLDQRFNAADANHDGFLDREEAKDMPMLTQYFNEVDTNKDGKVTRQEYFDAMPLLHGVKKIDTGEKPKSEAM
jgi:Ca2+-binding EF-hand superfamily protein